jgi:hypothetical protein
MSYGGVVARSADPRTHKGRYGHAITVLPEDEPAVEKRREWDTKKGLRLQFTDMSAVVSNPSPMKKPRRAGPGAVSCH